MNEFERALQLTMQLHALFKQGLGDSDEADEIRDRLDPYYGWGSSSSASQLSQEHRHLLARVSEALYEHAK